MRPGMSPGSVNEGSFGSIRHCSAGAERASDDELLERVLATRVRPGAPALVQQPEAGDVPQHAERAADAALVRQIGLERVVGDEGALALDADERPRADAQEGGLADP